MSITPGGRVLVMINSMGIGGAQTQLARLIPALIEAGWDVRVCTLLPPPDPCPALHQIVAAGVEVDVLDARSSRDLPRAAQRATRIVRQHRPDVLLSMLYQANVLARIVGRATDVPVISSIRNERFGSWWRDAALRLTDPLATVTTANSQQSAQSLLGRNVVRPGRILVVPNAIEALHVRDPDTWADARAAHGLRDEFVWLSVGRLDVQKDHETLLHAFARVVADHPESRLWLVGDGTLRRELEELASTLGIVEQTEFLGFRDDVSALMVAADALVLSSRWEGSPNAVLEAMAIGLPFVATMVGGVGELLDGGRAGIGVPPGSSDSLAGAMLCMAEMTPADRWRLAEEAQAVATDRHGMTHVVNQWLSLLEQVRRGHVDGIIPAMERQPASADDR